MIYLIDKRESCRDRAELIDGKTKILDLLNDFKRRDIHGVPIKKITIVGNRHRLTILRERGDK